MRCGLEVCVVPPLLKGPRWLTVASVSGDAAQLVSFEETSEREEAEELAGRFLLVRKSDLPEDFALMDAPSLIGRKVRDEELGPLGCIEEVMRGPVQDVWTVRGPHGEVLIPAVDEIVLSVDGDEIVVRVSDGMVEAKREGDDAI